MKIGEYNVDPVLVLLSKVTDIKSGLKRFTIYYGEEMTEAATLDQETMSLGEIDEWRKQVEECMAQRRDERIDEINAMAGGDE